MELVAPQGRLVAVIGKEATLLCGFHASRPPCTTPFDTLMTVCYFRPRAEMDTTKQRFEAEAGRILNERIARFRQAMDGALQSLASPIQVPAGIFKSETNPPHLEGLRALHDVVERGGRQREILDALLAAASACYPRTAIFIVRGNTLAGWAGRGFTPDSEGGQGLPPHMTLPTHGDHLLARALGARSFQAAGPDGPGFVVTEALGGVVPGRAGCIPLLVRSRPVALLYGDTSASGEQPAELAFEVIGRVGGLALASLASATPRRTRVTTTALAVDPPASTSAATPAAAGLGRGGMSTPHSPRTSAMRPDPLVAPPRLIEPPASAPIPPEDAEMQALLSDLDAMPRRESADSGMTPEERRQHADAKRFASLLVSELLLYNEESVIQGRKNHDLARRLAKEIERSRQAFALRVPAGLRGASGYFEDEMVRVLAEGDRSLLGN